MDKLAVLKWSGTGLVLTGILLTNMNIYPLNIMVHGSGSFSWAVAGIIAKDRAILVNFGMQLPLFAYGYMRVMGLA